MKRTAIPLLRDLRLLDDDVLDRNVGVSAAAAGLYPLDFVDDVLALDDLAEHAIAPTLRVRRRVIEKIVVLDVDEKLAGGRMRFGRPRHGDGIALVLEAVVALDHETLDDAVKHGIGVEA